MKKKIANLSSSDKLSGWRNKINDLIESFNELSYSFHLEKEKSLKRSSIIDEKNNINDLLPTQKGNSEKFLKTNGTDVEWVSLTPPTKLEAIPGCLPVKSGGTGTTSLDLFREKLFAGLLQNSNNKKEAILLINSSGKLNLIAKDELLLGNDKEQKDDIDYLKKDVKSLEEKISDVFKRLGEVASDISEKEALWKQYKVGAAGEYLLAQDTLEEFSDILFKYLPNPAKPIQDISENHVENSLLVSNSDGGIDYVPISRDVESIIFAESNDEIRSILLPKESKFFSDLRQQKYVENSVIFVDETGGVGSSFISDIGLDLLGINSKDELWNYVAGHNLPKIERALDVVENISSIIAHSGLIYKEGKSWKSIEIGKIVNEVLSANTSQEINKILGTDNVVKFVKNSNGNKVILANDMVITGATLGNWNVVEKEEIVTNSISELVLSDISASRFNLRCNEAFFTLKLSPNFLDFGSAKFSIIVTQTGNRPTVVKWDEDSFLVPKEKIDLTNKTTYLEFVKIDDKYACILQKGFA